MLITGIIILLAGCSSDSSKSSPEAKQSYVDYDKKAEEHLLNEMLTDPEETKERYELVAFDGFEKDYNQMLYQTTFYNPAIEDDSLYMISVVKKEGNYEVENAIHSIQGDHFYKNPLKDEVLRENKKSLDSIDYGQLTRLIEKYPEKSYVVHKYKESED